MEFRISQAEAEVEALGRAFAREVLAPKAIELDVVGGFPSESLASAADRGLLGVAVPCELGGLGAGAVAYALAVMQTARACAATTVALCVNNMVAEVVATFGTREQRERLVPRLCDGGLRIGAFALSEADAGSDPARMRTRARKSDHGWVLDGSKLWVTSGSAAGLFVVWARTSQEPGAHGISCFLVPGDVPGLVRGTPEAKMGLHGSTTTPLEFDEVELGADALLGDEGRGFAVAMMALDGGRIGIAAQSVGIAEAALELGRDELRRRSDDLGREAAEGWFADAATELSAARWLTLRAAWRKRTDQAFSHEAAQAKLFASERANMVCGRVLALFGLDGEREATGVERLVRDVRVAMIYEGTSEIQRLILARSILRRFEGRVA